MIRVNLFYQFGLEKHFPRSAITFFLVSMRKLTVSVHGRAALQWQRQYKFMLSGTSRNMYAHLSVCGLVGG